MAKTPPEGLVLKVCREIEDVSQEDLGRAAGYTRMEITRFEKGQGRLSLVFLGRLLRFPASVMDGLRRLLNYLYSGPEETSFLPLGLPLAERRAIAGAALTLAAAQARVLAESRLQDHIRADRGQARYVWLELKTRTLPEWRRFLGDAPQLATWALVETLTAESIRAAAADIRRARQWAELACWVAGQVQGGRAWRARVEGYAQAFLANALRVAGDLPNAEVAFGRAWNLRDSGVAAGAGPLDESRLYDLEASLRRDQRQWPEALERLDRALAFCLGPHSEGRILLKKAFVLEQMELFEKALETLDIAAERINIEEEPRNGWVLQYNRAVNFCRLGRFEESEDLVQNLRNQAIGLGNELDLVRILWLEARLAAGRGRCEEAESKLCQVRREFASRQLVYDVALVDLELASLYLKDGRMAETRELAVQVEPVFRALGVDREARQTVDVFWNAALRDQATLELLEKAVAALCRARPMTRL